MLIGRSSPVRRLLKFSLVRTFTQSPAFNMSFTEKGEYVRQTSAFRNWISADGSTGFKAEPGRYHLYVSLACPFASRALFMRKMKGLEDVISVCVVDWNKGEEGWAFTDKVPRCTLDTVNNCRILKDVYRKVDPSFNAKVTVPVLWDKVKNTIVNNESSEIIRMLNKEFDAFCKTDEQRKLDFYPEPLREKINGINEWVHRQINEGVYSAGFAITQEAYDKAAAGVFDGLDKVEDILSKSRYLVSNTQLTESDIRLFTSLVRFDWVYHTHFKLNKKRVTDYPNMWAFVRELYQIPGISETVDKDHIVFSYYKAMKHVNPLCIVPIGPDLDFMEPHGRDKM